MSVLQWWVGDTTPGITTSGVGNLSGYTAEFKMRTVGATALLISAAADVVGPPADGNLSYTWQPTDLDTVGIYLAWWDITLTADSTRIRSVNEQLIEVREHGPIDAPAYAELEEIKYTLSLTGQSYADLDIQNAVEAASRAIDNECGRFFYADPVGQASVSYYDASTPSMIIIDDLISLDELAMDYSGAGIYNTIVDPTGIVLGPYNNPNINRPYEWISRRISTQYFPTYLPQAIRVTGRHGWPEVPGPIKDATSMLAHRYVRRKREAPFGIMTVGMESARAIRISQSDPDVYQLISNYVRTQPFA